MKWSERLVRHIFLFPYKKTCSHYSQILNCKYVERALLVVIGNLWGDPVCVAFVHKRDI